MFVKSSKKKQCPKAAVRVTVGGKPSDALSAMLLPFYTLYETSTPHCLLRCHPLLLWHTLRTPWIFIVPMNESDVRGQAWPCVPLFPQIRRLQAKLNYNNEILTKIKKGREKERERKKEEKKEIPNQVFHLRGCTYILFKAIFKHLRGGNATYAHLKQNNVTDVFY